MDIDVSSLYAERIGGRTFGSTDKPYKFEKIKQAKRQAILTNPTVPLLDFGVGEPDWMADEKAVSTLATEAGRWEHRGYADNGMLAFQEAAASYMQLVYGVNHLNPMTEINHCMGSKAALAQLPAAFINKGDITLMTVPGYEILGTHTEWLGGEVYPLPLTEENQYLPDFGLIPESVRKQAKLLYLNYPNNPTGATASVHFYEAAIQFAKANQILVISDEAYGALVYDGEQPISFLSAEGAKEVGVAIQSLSKAFNMTGWRLGFLAGNESMVSAFRAVKDHYDSGQFLAIQQAGIYCLNHPEITEITTIKYARRMDLLVSALNEIGFRAWKPKGSFYLYTEAPQGIENVASFKTAEDFSQFLIRELLISTVPWDDAGRYIRFSVTYTANVEQEAAVMLELKSRLQRVAFIW